MAHNRTATISYVVAVSCQVAHHYCMHDILVLNLIIDVVQNGDFIGSSCQAY